jgi:hypothetical protein
MKKLVTYQATYLAYNVPVIRQAAIYGDTEAENGCTFEVSTHTGNMGVLWEFKPFDSLSDATVYALKFLARSDLHQKLENKA